VEITSPTKESERSAKAAPAVGPLHGESARQMLERWAFAKASSGASSALPRGRVRRGGARLTCIGAAFLSTPFLDLLVTGSSATLNIFSYFFLFFFFFFKNGQMVVLLMAAVAVL